MKIISLIADQWKMDGGVAFGVVPKSIWSKQYSADQNNMIDISTRCLLVDTGDQKIIFDTGMGRKQNERYYGFRYLSGGHSIEKALKEKGYSTNDITDVVFTHLHDDHCGGAIKLDSSGNPVAVFEQAMHYCSSDQWEWANKPNSREGASFLPINYSPLMDAGRLELIDNEGSFLPGISLRQLNGHTRGMLVPQVEAKGKTFVFMADFIPLAANIQLPWVPSVDVQPLVSMNEKETFLEEAVAENYHLIFEHDHQVEGCTLHKSDKGIRMDSSFNLLDFFN